MIILKKEKSRSESCTPLEDPAMYTCCGVCFFNEKPLSYYRIGKEPLHLGDDVIVREQDETRRGRVLSIGHYSRLTAPRPIEKMPFVLKKCG